MRNLFFIGSGPGPNTCSARTFDGKTSFTVNDSDKKILRELAKKYSELAALPVNAERKQRIIDMHNLKQVRPPLWVEELPWHELNINGELNLKCEGLEARSMEGYFRRAFVHWNYFQGDMVLDNVIGVAKSYSSTGMGLEIEEETLSTNPDNNVVSHHYEDILDTEDKVAKLKLPKLTAYPDVDKKYLEIASGIFDGIIPVKLRGYQIFFCPWDKIAQYRGAQNAIMDTIENPELLHATMKKLTAVGETYYGQMETLGLLDYDITDLHCCPPFTDKLPAPDYKSGGVVRKKDIWFRGMAQPFTMVSPETFDEFEIQYMAPVMEQYGLSYYGCCEKLERVIPYLRKIKNLKKLTASPWANIRSMSEQMGADYVMGRKLNPAAVALELDIDAITKEIKETIEICIENKTPYELVLKDVSTVGGKPENLTKYVEIANKIIDGYYR